MPTLTPPTYRERIVPYDLTPNNRLLARYSLDKGYTLLVKGAVVTQVTYPYQGDLAQYDFVYMGGRNYPLTPGEVTTLTNAGYGAYIH
jgi:hypothetical protein